MENEFGDYVIVHELLHFNIPTLGKLWKSLMTAYLGDWRTLEERLKRENFELYTKYTSEIYVQLSVIWFLIFVH